MTTASLGACTPRAVAAPRGLHELPMTIAATGYLRGRPQQRGAGADISVLSPYGVDCHAYAVRQQRPKAPARAGSEVYTSSTGLDHLRHYLSRMRAGWAAPHEVSRAPGLPPRASAVNQGLSARGRLAFRLLARQQQRAAHHFMSLQRPL